MKNKSSIVVVAICTFLCHWTAFCYDGGVFMKKIHLGGKYGSVIGNYALVDDEDYECINKHRWHVHSVSNLLYARRTEKSGGVVARVLMHRQIMSPSSSLVFCDHIDGSGLNNQRSNIRESSHSQNQRNRANNRNCSSKYKGVYFAKKTNKWMSQIYVCGKTMSLGCFVTEKEAAQSYNDAAIMHYGEFARLNVLT